MDETSLNERTIADAIVEHVCRCKPTPHIRGYPECATARRAARAVLKLYDDLTAAHLARESP